VKRQLFWPRILLSIALAVTLVMALLPHPPHLPIDALGDKFEHSLAFIVLTVLACLSYPNADRFRIGERLSFLGAMIEVLQSIPSLHRDCDILDWIADTTAIVITLLILSMIRRGSLRSGIY
jgi:hypothetical protein